MQTISVEIFKTDVLNQETADSIIKKLSELFPESQFNFDLDDCDKILRAEGNDFVIATIENTLVQSGFSCGVLE